MSNKSNFITSCTMALIALTLFTGKSYGAPESNTAERMLTTTSQGTISVPGEGTASAAPDLAKIEAAVVTRSATASDAISSNNTTMDAVLDALENLGIEEKDIQTSMINLSPYYNKSQTNQNVIAGYRASHGLTICIRKMDKVGETLDGMITAGINQVSGIRFTVENSDQLESDARKMAVADASAKAKLYASELRVTVGDVISLREGSFRFGSSYMSFKEVSASDIGSVPIVAPSEVTYYANINIDFAISN